MSWVARPGGELPGACLSNGVHRPQQSFEQACLPPVPQATLAPVLPSLGRAGLYNFCKALEALETGVLGGFYFKVGPGRGLWAPFCELVWYPALRRGWGLIAG